MMILSNAASMGQPVLIWLVLLVVFIVVELATLGLATIWFAGGALIAALAAMLGAPIFVQVVLFVLVSGILLVFTRPIAVKYFNKDRIKTNAESLVGMQAIVISEIDNLQGAGRVTINGVEWMGRNIDKSKTIPVGTVVIIRAIDGAKLIVEERKED